MRLHSILFFIFLLSLAPVHAGNVTITGAIMLTSGNMPPAVTLQPYAGGGDDIIVPVTGGKFSISVAVERPALYNLRLLYASYDIMFAPAEKEITISIDWANDKLKNIRIKGSRESDAYSELAQLSKDYDDKVKKLMIKCEKEQSCEKELNELLSLYKYDLLIMGDTYKGSYTADTLCKMKAPVVAKNIKSTLEDFRGNYFGQVPFADRAIVGNPVYKDMITAYVEFVIESKYSKQEAGLRELMGKAKADPVVYSKTAGMLYEALFSKSKEKMLGIFITYYNENKTAIDNPVLDAKVKSLTTTMPGGHYVNIVRPDIAGRQTSLKEVAGKSKCTLLLFWASDCSHCQEEMPQIKEVFGKYHSRGLSIFAVSLEQDPQRWETYIKENGLSWTNVLNQRQGTDNPALQYMVSATPTLILIDKHGVIVHRFTPKNKLEKYIEEVLAR